MTNWRSIDCSTPDGLRELDILTAQRLGWRVERSETSAYLCMPSGARVMWQSTRYDDSQMWQLAGRHIPYYTSDLSAATGLPIPDRYALRLIVSTHRIEARLIGESPRDPDTSTVFVEDRITYGMQEMGSAPSANKEALARVLVWHALMDTLESKQE